MDSVSEDTVLLSASFPIMITKYCAAEVRGSTVISIESVNTSLLAVSLMVAVIVTVPCETPLTLPFSSTVATWVSLLLQLTVLLVASAGSTAAVNRMTFPTSTVVGTELSIESPVTGTGSCSV